jgi:hypothetical protein
MTAPYTPQTWVDANPSYPLSAARMLNMENGVAAATSGVIALEALKPLSSGWTVTGQSSVKSGDKATITMDDVVDMLFTLVADLKAAGLLS